MQREVEEHPFWSQFFRLAEPLHPELAGRTPTPPDRMRKINPRVARDITVDICWSRGGGVTLVLLSSKPDVLRPYIDKDAFVREIGMPEAWSEGTDKYLGYSVKPASKAVQKGWSEARQALEAMELYQKMKEYIAARS